MVHMLDLKHRHSKYWLIFFQIVIDLRRRALLCMIMMRTTPISVSILHHLVLTHL